MTDSLALAADMLDQVEDRPKRRWPSADRPDQNEPGGDWHVWLICAGRGWGKTFCGSAWLLTRAMSEVGTFAVVAPTYSSVRDICVEGESGILKAALPGEVTGWNRSLGEITLSNRSKIFAISADEVDKARGLNLAGLWADELGSWKYEATWTEGLMPALRVGKRPQALVTTTPRPTRLLKDLLGRTDGSVTITRGSTFANSMHLSAVALAELRHRYEGTRIGRQELNGEMLDDVDGALWTIATLDASRVTTAPTDLVRVVIGVDPSVSAGPDSDLTGIVVCGTDRNHHGYVIADYSIKASPDAWAKRVVEAYDRHHADMVVVEKNNGGSLVSGVIRTVRPTIPIKEVWASRGKQTRAEPIAAMFEQAKIHIVGSLPELEDELTGWCPGHPKSPDRLDAMVWALTAITAHSNAESYLQALATMCTPCGFPNRRGAPLCGHCGQPLH